uniref:CAAX prenyl protease 2 n=1 Tax=Aegilops tauschii subsp. strangulata TaxID=200361 RepID=A0A452YXC9_AEGTS
MQLYEISPDCWCPIRLHCNFRVVCCIFVHPNRGNLVSPIVAHILCNMMGLPVFSSQRTRGLTSLAFLAGSVSFFCLLFPATSPKLYNARLDGCSCWHGYCRWS